MQEVQTLTSSSSSCCCQYLLYFFDLMQGNNKAGWISHGSVGPGIKSKWVCLDSTSVTVRICFRFLLRSQVQRQFTFSGKFLCFVSCFTSVLFCGTFSFLRTGVNNNNRSTFSGSGGGWNRGTKSLCMLWFLWKSNKSYIPVIQLTATPMVSTIEQPMSGYQRNATL